jgi:hypothetical protein
MVGPDVAATSGEVATNNVPVLTVAGVEGEEPFDLESIIADLLADPSRDSVQLPRLTTGQRKQAKQLVEKYETLACESFGFGPERRLHLFKRASRATTASIEACKHLEHVAPTLAVDVENGRPGELPEERTPSKEDSCSGNTTCSLSEPITHLSSRGSSPLPSSPASIPELPVEPQEVPIVNTFIHFDSTPDDQRVIRSMPHKMFRQCVLQESSVPESLAQGVDVASTAAPVCMQSLASGCWLAPGAEVCIDGLTKQPAFNGLMGVVESFDESTSRYTVCISSSSAVGRRQTAKVRSENLRCVIRAVPCMMLPCSPTTSSHPMSPLSTSPSSTRW